MPWAPRGGKALSRAASGRVPGPRTTNSCVKGTMLLIIFVTLLKIASFEHSLRGAAAAAHRIGLDLEDVEFAAHLAQPVVERAEAFVEQVETAAARDVAYARSHLVQPVLEHAGAFLEAPVEELGRDYQLVADALRVLARPDEEPDALEAKAAELDAIGDADSLEAERAQRAAQEAELKAAAAAKEKAEAERYEAERAKRIADAEKRVAAERETVLYAIVTPSIVREKVKTGNDRQKLVRASLKAWPALRRFNASYQLDRSCVSILQQRHITISPKYYSEERGVGWIHAGKVGHWCSFLRYLVHCSTSDAVVCVWIEDDFKLSAKNIQTIETQASKIAERRGNKYAVTSLGLGDEVNIIDSRLIHLLLDRFHRFEITGPLDIALRVHTRLGTANRVFGFNDRIFVGKETSTLVCSTCALLSVQTVNKLINTTGH